MKRNNILELNEHLKKRLPFKIYVSGEEFGTFYYDETKKRYQGEIGYIELEEMVQIIKNPDFIELEII